MTAADQPTVYQCACASCQAGTAPETARYHQQLNLLLSRLNEPQRRWQVGFISQQPHSPSDRHLSLITGLDEKTIQRGRRELSTGLPELPAGKQRCAGGGRPGVKKKIQR